MKFCDDYTFYDEATLELIKNPGLHVVSEQILKAMCYMYTEKRHKIFDSDMCKFFYYWLADILINNLNDNHFTSEVLINLYRILNKAGAGKICDPINSYIDKDNFENIKLIFDYSEDYESYKLDLAIPNRSCNENYKKYLQKYVKKYNVLYDYCKVEEHCDKYCTEFFNHFYDKEHSYLSTWTCNLEGTELKINLLGDNHESDVGPPKKPETAGGEAYQKQLEEANLEGIRSARHDNPPGSHLYTTVSKAETESVSLPSDNPSPSTIKKSITSAASAAGLLVPPFLVYHVIAIVIVQRDVLCYI
ncbi:hypothetical protein PVMG_05091 [Plasmodium vivax Mauritania I]|uniref:Variable surface protein Vir7-like protein n=1 Tax=Plasmodium vivax Mauritania I TaxID=1035515 RepID=A0A0J9W481_PLAVI|nr:hypothetical protein PVMG_05091 [Plasmodium vivax Mauritania I]